MSLDPIVDEIDQVRHSMLTQCGGDLKALLQSMAADASRRTGRVHSKAELDQLFPPAQRDNDAIASLVAKIPTMRHEREIETIISQVKPWPEEDRVALAYLILRDMRTKTRESPPRQTLQTALGIARGKSPPPDDATVKKWIEEHRQSKYG